MIRKTTPERLSFFSDAIFAVLITVLVLELHPPERPTFEALLERWPTWLSYAVSYLLRVLDSIQLTARHKVATPVNWKPGGDIIISGAVSDDEAKRLYPGGGRLLSLIFALSRNPNRHPPRTHKKERLGSSLNPLTLRGKRPVLRNRR